MSVRDKGGECKSGGVSVIEGVSEGEGGRVSMRESGERGR